MNQRFRYLVLMRRSLVFLLIAFLSIVGITVSANAAIKAGSTCSKVNSIVVVSNIKYTCIQSGVKLIWSKGVKVSVTTPILAVPEVQKIQVVDSLATDERISKSADLSKVELCKTTDNTPNYLKNNTKAYSNGFPRPSGFSTDKQRSRVLIIPLIFSNRPFFTEKVQVGQLFGSDLELLQSVLPRVKESLKELSVGRFEIDLEILPEADWWRFKEEVPFGTTWGTDHSNEMTRLIKLMDGKVDFNAYDSYVFVTGRSEGGKTSSAFIFNSIQTSKGEAKNFVLMNASYNDAQTFVHELGHSMFALEDLYFFNQAAEATLDPGTDVPLKWDMMASSTRASLLNWNRLLMGWVKDSEIRCLSDQQLSTHYLAQYKESKEPKLLLVNLAPGVTIAAESKNAGTESGLLLYVIDTFINHGEGPIRAQKSLLPTGQSKMIYGWQFSVVSTSAEGLLVEVKKTGGSAYVAPIVVNRPGPEPAPSTITSTTGPSILKNEIVQIGPRQARAIFTVTNYQSYRVFVTAIVDFQKVFFESGFINDSRSPLVVEMNNLVCGQQIRVVSAFYSERDGKGEVRMIDSRQLPQLACQG